MTAFLTGWTGAAGPGSGTIQELTLKFGPSRLRSSGAVRQGVVSSRPREPRVLLVDDSKTMLDVLKIHLSGGGFDLVCFDQARAALAAARRSAPSLIITDLNMPDMGGLDLCRQLQEREDTASVPVIIVSSKLTEKLRNEAHDLGVRTCLPKPVRPNLLRAAVNQSLSMV